MTTTTVDESKYADDIINLEDEIEQEHIVNILLVSFHSKSVILQLNPKYVNNVVEVLVTPEDWNRTNKRFDNILTSKGVTEEDRIELLRLLNHNANRITDHFAEKTVAHMHAGRRAKIERKEKTKNKPAKEVSISDALRMIDVS